MKPLVIAHRGWSGRYPENTMSAIEAAIGLGVDFVEIDVQQTNEGQLVVFHDDRLDRVYGVPKRVREARRDELRNAPTLAEALRVCRGRARVLVEIKNADPVNVARVIQRCRMVKQVIVFSFDPRRLQAVARTSPRIALFGLSEHGGQFELAKVSCRGWGLGLPAVNAPAVVQAYHDRGLKVFVWTVDRRSDMQRLIRWGVDGIITNHPDRLVALVATDS